jgi:hypothetical protein
MKNSIIKNFLAFVVFATALLGCGSEPDRIIFSGKDFVFFEASEVVPLLENSADPLEIPVKVSLAQDEDVTVAYTIEENGAIEGIDFEILSPNPITISAGEYETAIEIAVINNEVFETESRTFSITLTEISPSLDKQVLTSVTVDVVNEDCPAEIPKIVNWIGSLSVEDVGFGASPGTGDAGPDGSCGGVLIMTGDLLAFGLDSKITLVFTQDSPGSTTGTVEVARDRFFTDDAYAGYQYEASGTYNEATQEIIIDYNFYRPNGTLWFPGTHYIIPD